jgi:hypothetical protein
MGFTPLATAPLADSGAATDLAADATFRFTVASAVLSSGFAFAAAAALALTQSTTLTTAIRLAGSAATGITASAALGALHALGAAATLAVTGYAALIPLTQIGVQTAELRMSGTAELTTNESLRASAVFKAFANDNTDFAELHTIIPLAAAANIFTLNPMAALGTGVQLAGAAALAITGTADMPLTKFFQTAADIGFTSSANLRIAPVFQAASDIHFIANADLTTSIDLAGSASIFDSIDAVLTTGPALRGVADVLGVTASASLSTPAPGTVPPWETTRMRATFTYSLDGVNEYSSFTLEA